MKDDALIAQQTEALILADRADQRKVALSALEASLSSTVEITQSVRAIAETWLQTAQLKIQMAGVVAQMEIDAMKSIEKTRLTAPQVARQVESITRIAEGILNDATKIDVASCNDRSLQHRTQLLREISGLTQQACNLTMKLLDI